MSVVRDEIQISKHLAYAEAHIASAGYLAQGLADAARAGKTRVRYGRLANGVSTFRQIVSDLLDDLPHAE